VDFSPDMMKRAAQQLWHQLENRRSSMLMIEAAKPALQPVSHFADPERGLVWFICSRDSALVSAFKDVAPARLNFVSNSEDYFASLSGEIEIADDPKQLDHFWSYAADAWFEQGRNDPSVVLLKMTPQKATAWVAQGQQLLVAPKSMCIQFGVEPVKSSQRSNTR